MTQNNAIASTTSMNYDNHSIYIGLRGSTEEQLRRAIDDAITEMLDVTDISRTMLGHELNVIKRADGSVVGLAYLWIRNPLVYNCFLGLNPDGTGRFEHVKMRDWSPPDERSVEEAVKMDVWDANYSSWADSADAEEKVRDSYTHPVVPIKLPPINGYLGYKPNASQKKLIESGTLKEVKVNPDTVQEGGLSSSGYMLFDIKRMRAEPDERHRTNVLISYNIPRWLTKEDVYRSFSQFVSNPHKTRQMNIDGRKIQVPYPLVFIDMIRGSLNLTVEFEPCTHDGVFAEKMRKVTMFNIRGSAEMKPVIFKHPNA